MAKKAETVKLSKDMIEKLRRAFNLRGADLQVRTAEVITVKGPIDLYGSWGGELKRKYALYYEKDGVTYVVWIPPTPAFHLRPGWKVFMYETGGWRPPKLYMIQPESDCGGGGHGS